MDENDVWLAGVFLDGVWSGTEGADVWAPTGTATAADDEPVKNETALTVSRMRFNL